VDSSPPAPGRSCARSAADVKLVSGPKGSKPFQSEAGAAGYVFKRRLTKPGVYKILCTFHEEDGMRQTITVRHG
jgi:plastocyanin